MGQQWTFHVIDFNRICHSLQVVEEKVLGNLLTVHKHVGGTCAPVHWPDRLSCNCTAVGSSSCSGPFFQPPLSWVFYLYLLSESSCSVLYPLSFQMFPSLQLFSTSNSLSATAGLKRTSKCNILGKNIPT